MSFVKVSLDAQTLEDAMRMLHVGPKIIADATRRAVGAAASYLRQRMKDYIQSGGGGSWDAISPVTKAIRDNPPKNKNAPKPKYLSYKASKLANRHRTAIQRRKDSGIQEKPGGFLGKLSRTMRYFMPDKGEPTALVGVLRQFMSKKAIAYFDQFQKGGKLLMTYRSDIFTQPSMLRYFGGLGFKMSRNKTIMQPKREVVQPVFEKESTKVFEVMEVKFLERIEHPK